MSYASPGALPADRLATRLYAYVFFEDLVLLYPLYAVLFAQTGLSTAQISSLFVLWALTSLLVEVPSGVWADLVSRRLMLVLAPLCAGTGFALWVLVPSYPAFAAGFVLWGLGGALRSGALESLVYEELARSGAQQRYLAVIGRSTAVATAAVAAGTALAAPVFAVGGYAAVGAASVTACLACAAVAVTFPHGRDVPTSGSPEGPGAQPDQDDPAGYRAYLALLRTGLAQVRGRPSVRSAVLLVPVVSALWGSLEEFTPLLAAQTGVAVALVPLLLVLLDAGIVAGGLAAGVARGGLMSRRTLATWLTVGAMAMAAGALVRHPAGFVALAVAFGAFQLATVATDARLQHAIDGRARSTITSLAGLGTDLATIAVYGLYALGSTVLDHAGLYALAAVGYLVIAAVALRRPRPGR